MLDAGQNRRANRSAPSGSQRDFRPLTVYEQVESVTLNFGLRLSSKDGMSMRVCPYYQTFG